MNFLRKVSGINPPAGGVTFKWDENRENVQVYFLVGCSIGNKISLLPSDTQSRSGVDDLKDILARKSEFKVSAQKLNDLIPKLSNGNKPQNDLSKTLAEQYFSFFEELYICGKVQGTEREIFYLNFGKLLFEIPNLIRSGYEVPLSFINAVEALSETRRFPDSICKMINGFCESAMDGNRDLLDMSNEIALTINLII